MTRVTTAFGQVYAHTLRERDRVRTKNGDFLAITKIDRMTFDENYLKYSPDAQPILIRAGAMARGIPAVDILLAPHQRMSGAPLSLLQGANKAMDALGRPHVCRKSELMITYTTVHCDKPAQICCEGLWVETTPYAPYAP